MKRARWWTLLGTLGAGVATMFVGQGVRGQLGAQRPPEILNARPDAGAGQGWKGDITVPLPEVLPASVAPASSALPPLAGRPATVTASPPLLPVNAVQTLPPASAELRSPSRNQPSVSIEWIGPPVMRVNQPTTCQIFVRNTSTAAVNNVVVRQRMPQGIVCKASEPPATSEGDDLAWNLGTLAPEQARRIDMHLVFQTRGAATCQATVTFTGSTARQVQVLEPLLNVKMRAPEKVIAGEQVTLLFTLSNPGDGVADQVKLKILLPEGLAHSRGKVVEVDVSNLAPKESRTMQLICLAKGSGAHKCTVITTADGGLSATDSVNLEVLTPALEMAIAGPKLRYLDRHAIYVAKIANPGSAATTNVEVSQVIPAGFKFHQAGQGGQYQQATRTVSWTIGDLQPGQSREIAIDLIPIEPGNHRLVAHARSGRLLKTEAETHTVVEGLPSLTIELVDLDDPIEVGAETAYELHVTNTGTKPETNLEVVCLLPDQFEFKGAKCSTTVRHRVEGREVIFEPLPRLAPKADVIYRIQVRGAAPGDVRFRARIRSDDIKEPIVREQRTRIYSDDAPTRSTVSVTPAAPVPAIPASPTVLPTSLEVPSVPTTPVIPPPPARQNLPPAPVPTTLPTLPRP